MQTANAFGESNRTSLPSGFFLLFSNYCTLLFALTCSIVTVIGGSTASAATILETATWSGNDHTYYLVRFDERADWDQARAETLDLFPGYDLATITSPEENAFIKNTLLGNNAGDYWIGAFQTAPKPELDPAAGWNWVTGEEWDYTNWGPIEPNNAGGFEDHATFEYFGTWNDCCTAPGAFGFIAEQFTPAVPYCNDRGRSPTTGGKPLGCRPPGNPEIIVNPLPPSVALFLGGFGVLGLMARRRRTGKPPT